MTSCNRQNSTYRNAGGAGASIIGQGIQQVSNLTFALISEQQKAEIERQNAARQYAQQMDFIESQTRQNERAIGNQSALNAFVESRKKNMNQNILQIAVVFGVFVVIGIGIYYASK